MNNNNKNNFLIAQNKKAYHDYFVEETFEAGIELLGTEVKSARQSAVNIKDSWCNIKNQEIFILGLHISPYEKGNIFNKDPLRVRKLLLHKKEIIKLFEKTKKQGFTIVPLKIYFNKSKVKVLIGLCKGKKLHDKREAIAQKDAERKIDRALKNKNY
ncbi:MAG: SsrA-binding protein SmpB [Oscillospiraceae bacterium]|nr:SsrA-binding protein SmpB [Oscillospiraceae bacterium]